MRIRKFVVCKSRSETMSAREGLLEPACCASRVKKESRSEGSAPWGWVFFAGCALVSGSASKGMGGEPGRSSAGRVPGEKVS